MLDQRATPCYRPKGHTGDCGEPIDQAEDEQRILYGACGPFPAFVGAIYGARRQRSDDIYPYHQCQCGHWDLDHFAKCRIAGCACRGMRPRP